MRRYKSVLSIVGAFLLSLLALNYMTGALSPQNTAFDAALAACRAKGWQNANLAQTSLQVSNSVLGGAAEVSLKTTEPNQPKTVRVLLRRRINLLGWEVVGYTEQ